MRFSSQFTGALLGVAVFCTPACAWAQPVPKALASAPEVSTAAEAGTRKYVTQHEGTFNGRKVAYTATLGETIVKAPDGKPAASMFNFSYVARNVKDAPSRPVLFIFNGGPGGASSVLHFGAFGPKRLASFTSAAQSDANTPLIDNTFTVLDVADVVMIDPPETGFSRLLPGTPPGTFHGVDSDSYACAQFVALWLKQNGRLNSPKYIIGESYGSLRAVGMVRELEHASPKIMVDGVMLISQAITYGAGRSRLRDPISPIKYVPGQAALAWYHGKIDNQHQTVQEVLEKARVFSRTEYAAALIQGNRLSEAERKHVAEGLHALTGIPVDYYLSHDLRVNDYMNELLRADGKVLMRNDGRETQTPRPAGERATADTYNGFNANMNKYAAGDLKAVGLDAYVTLARISNGWDYGAAPEPTLDVVLSQEMKTNPNLRLVVTQGIFDTTTEIANSEFTMSQIDLPMDRYTMAYYPGGHMLYSDPDGLKMFTDDVRSWIAHKPMAIHDGVIKPGTPSK